MKTPACSPFLACLAVCLSISTAVGQDLTFEDRLRAEAALERVRHAHRRDVGPTPGRPASREVLEKRVRSFLADSVALEDVWSTPVTAEMLDAELERIMRDSRMPGRLREYFAALGDDPRLIREAVARPALVRRLVRSFFAFDRHIHEDSRARAESLRRAAEAGTLDPAREHPLRAVVDAEEGESGALAGPQVVEIAEAFVVDVPFDGLVARYVVRKLSWEAWRSEVGRSLRADTVPTVATDETTPALAGFLDGSRKGAAAAEACDYGVWDNASLDDVPDPRHDMTVVWTGAEMIVWGGYNGTITLDTGGRYDPAIDDWAPTSRMKVPAARYHHTAVWTGNRMIVWGGATIPGGGDTATGSSYDPVSDLWTRISEVGAPAGRRWHSAIWTGSEMIVWGGGNGYDGTGGRYDPGTDTWARTSTDGAPTGRKLHTAVWTGSEMIVWGGRVNELSGAVQNTGGRYDPSSDTWTPTPTQLAPDPRAGHTAVWTGTTMIVWGGEDGEGSAKDTGGVYDPGTGSWTPTASRHAPGARDGHMSIWTGSEMIVWGGIDLTGYLDTGGRYDPAKDRWRSTTLTGAPSARAHAGAVWDGSRMIVWGGLGLRATNTGGRYDPAGDSWTPTTVRGAPTPRRGATAVWTGAEMIVWGGSAGPELDTGGRYDPALDVWSDTSTSGAPSPRVFHSAVWSGDLMIVWGGSGTGVGTGGRYDPVADSWSPTSLAGAPSPRRSHTAIWTGTEMIVWGGSFETGFLDTGSRYDPPSDTWTSMTNVGAPSPRRLHTAVWTGSEMIVWGGEDPVLLGTGGRYSPADDAWIPVDVTHAPTARREHTAVWSGSEMIVWGGNATTGQVVDDGGRYDPLLDNWVPTAKEPATPSARTGQRAVWSGSEMLVWGGRIPGTQQEYPQVGGRYAPDTDSWWPIDALDAPSGRYDHSIVWTGSEMIVWGGANAVLAEVSSGGRYCGCLSATFYRDGDGDGLGDDGDTVEACLAPDGFVDRAGDCNDENGSIWSTPGEVVGVRFTGTDTIVWSAPDEPGCAAPRYDVVRSENPEEFEAGSECVASDVGTTEAVDAATPGSGVVLHYLVRSENDCPAGSGPLGDRTDGTPRTARDCP